MDMLLGPLHFRHACRIAETFRLVADGRSALVGTLVVFPLSRRLVDLWTSFISCDASVASRGCWTACLDLYSVHYTV